MNDEKIPHGIYRRFWPKDVIRFQLGGGGGFGDAFEREVDRVIRDFHAGLISIEGAERDYGVVIDQRTLTVDRQKSAALRAKYAETGGANSGRSRPQRSTVSGSGIGVMQE